ncbi:hypothetical protein QW131_27855 [Roseibium salinum]|nr:hypothetical protein [Roseibium salinum]
MLHDTAMCALLRPEAYILAQALQSARAKKILHPVRISSDHDEPDAWRQPKKAAGFQTRRRIFGQKEILTHPHVTRNFFCRQSRNSDGTPEKNCLVTRQIMPICGENALRARAALPGIAV